MKQNRIRTNLRHMKEVDAPPAAEGAEAAALTMNRTNNRRRSENEAPTKAGSNSAQIAANVSCNHWITLVVSTTMPTSAAKAQEAPNRGLAQVRGRVGRQARQRLARGRKRTGRWPPYSPLSKKTLPRWTLTWSRWKATSLPPPRCECA